VPVSPLIPAKKPAPTQARVCILAFSLPGLDLRKYPETSTETRIREFIMKYRLTRQLMLLCMAGASSGVSLWSGAATAAGDAAAGAEKSIFCAYCHGTDGNPLDKAAPRLAGQNPETLVAKMKHQTRAMGQHELMIQAFRTGRALNDRDMNDLAAYFSQQPARESVQTAHPQLPEKTER
jgi:cytochrome c553